MANQNNEAQASHKSQVIERIQLGFCVFALLVLVGTQFILLAGSYRSQRIEETIAVFERSKNRDIADVSYVLEHAAA
ncbi:MAG: hypothetical protein AAF456_25450, partial [Planctomycetota bacterium]